MRGIRTPSLALRPGRRTKRRPVRAAGVVGACLLLAAAVAVGEAASYPDQWLW